MDLSRGYVRLFRSIDEWEWYDNPFIKAIFIHCITKANDKAKKWRDLELKRGQFVTSYEKLAAANGMTIQQTRTALKQLQLTNDIEYQSTNQYTVITVKKYNLWQATNTRKIEADSIPTNKQKGGQITTTNNSIDISNNYIYTHTRENEKSVCEKIKISKEDRQILREYAKKSKAQNITAYVHTLIANGGYIDILKDEKARLERLKQKENIPPPEEENEPEETPEEIEKARAAAHAKVLQLKNPKRKKG